MAQTNRRHFLGGIALGGATVAVGAFMPRFAPGIGPATASAGGVGTAMNVGRGMADMTGEPLGAGMNGYAALEQTSAGIHHRQFARAFVFVDDEDERVVHVTADMGLMFQSIQMEVLRRLAAVHGNIYHEGNVLIGASHTHVTPGGTSGHAMVDITTLGFRPATFEAAVSGIVSSVNRAHDDISPALITLTVGQVADAGVNRSRLAFDRNPEEEKAQVPGGVNPDSTTLHIIRDGAAVGLINWYGIHPTTFGADYPLISGDSKGYAAWSMEHSAGVDHLNPAAAPYVAAFAMSTPGDISPNHGLIPGSGPGVDEYDSARILGRHQAEGTNGTPTALPGGGIRGRWGWTDMRDVSVDRQYTDHGQTGQTGPAVLGAAFAASSQEDGGGIDGLPINEGEYGGTPWARQLGEIILPAHVLELHNPKESLLPVGYIDGLIQQVHIFHVHQIAGFTIVSCAFEPTTVAGLRIRTTVADILGVDRSLVLVQGYVSGYGHYAATPQEYDQQDYEGGATAFGRDTLPAITQTLANLTHQLKDGLPNRPGSASGDLVGFIPTSPAGAPNTDVAPDGAAFGDVLESPEGPVSSGEQIEVVFAAANPNHDLRHESGYHRIEDSAGARVADDAHEDSRIIFSKEGNETRARIIWDTTDMEAGEYSVRFSASSRDESGNLTPFDGVAMVTIGA